MKQTPKQRLIKRLKKGWVTSKQWCDETGSTKLTSRISELRESGIFVGDRWHTLKSGTKVKQYAISETPLSPPSKS